jgi:Lrp/AsnC family leucine-responsive transcriptional regulator
MKRSRNKAEPVLDDIDRRILRQVQRNGRLNNNELAQAVGLSASPCWARMRRLEEAGFIEGYVAVLNQSKLGFPDTVVVEVTLDKHEDNMVQKFGAALTALPEVLEAYLTTGEYDYFIKVAVSGTEGYERFLREKLYRIPGIRHTRSCFALRCLKRELSVSP